MPDSILVEACDLTRTYQMDGETIQALRGVNFTIHKGELVAITGPSGSGKSTLLGLLGGLDSPTSGRILLDGIDLTGLNERQMTRLRNEKIGFVFQFFNLIPTLSALENVALPVQFARRRIANPTQRARQLLALLGLEDRLNHRPDQLSGGQQQRVAIARALANNPPLLLADEPTGNLNRESGARVLAALQQVQAEFGTTVVIVTHDPQVAALARRTLTLVDGQIAAPGPSAGQAAGEPGGFSS